MKYFDCGLVEDELCVARDSQHHYLIKFSISDGKWILGNKRRRVRIFSFGDKYKITMTMGYYEESLELNMRLGERVLKLLMDEACC